MDLNYDETVVYDNDAIRPAFLIVYGEDSIKSDLKYSKWPSRTSPYGGKSAQEIKIMKTHILDYNLRFIN